MPVVLDLYFMDQFHPKIIFRHESKKNGLKVNKKIGFWNNQHQLQMYLLPYSFDVLPAGNASQSSLLIFGSAMDCEELYKKAEDTNCQELVQEYTNCITV